MENLRPSKGAKQHQCFEQWHILRNHIFQLLVCQQTETIPTIPAVDGDMWVQFTEALSFQPEPEIIQNKSASNNGQSGRRLGTVPASELETRFVFRKS